MLCDTMQLDWKPVIRSLFRHLAKAGFVPVKVNDGEEIHTVTNASQATEVVCAVDDSTVTISKDGKWVSKLFIVLGNEPFETVADWTIPANKETENELDAALESFSEVWERRKTPLAK